MFGDFKHEEKQRLLDMDDICQLENGTPIVACYNDIENTKLYQLIAPNSFGIYLFHEVFIYWLEFIAAPYEISPMLLSFGVFVISLTLSVFLTITVRNIGLGIIIGEKT